MSYRAPIWLPGGHAQTIYPVLLGGAMPNYQRERWETPDGDFIDVDFLVVNNSIEIPDNTAKNKAENTGNNTPLLILFHGLEGSSHSHYARALMRTLATRGWAGAVPNFRGCSGEPNRLARAYHSGDTAEIDWILRRFRQRFPQRRIVAAGVSLGGNALLKWLGEQGAAALGVVQAAAAISAPVDLTASGMALQQGFNVIYSKRFLATLVSKALAKLDRYPSLFNRDRMLAAKTLYDFDDIYTAPVHGYLGAYDYWARASAKPGLVDVRIPTLLINALNDPFLPASHLPENKQVSSVVTLEYPAGGGHVGFASNPFIGHLNWLPQRLLAFFDASHASHSTHSAT